MFDRRWHQARKMAGLPNRITHDFRRTVVRNLERAGVPRSVAMKLTRHKTEAVYRRYAIVCEADLTEGIKKLAALSRDKSPVCGTVTDVSHSLATIPGQKYHITRENMAEGRDLNSRTPDEVSGFQGRPALKTVRAQRLNNKPNSLMRQLHQCIASLR